MARRASLMHLALIAVLVSGSAWLLVGHAPVARAENCEIACSDGSTSVPSLTTCVASACAAACITQCTGAGVSCATWSCPDHPGVSGTGSGSGTTHPCNVLCSDGTAGSDVGAAAEGSDSACFSSCQRICGSHGGCYDFTRTDNDLSMAGNSCAHAAASTGAGRTTLSRLISTATDKSSTWSCQTMPAIDSGNCVANGCGSTAATFCCKAGAASANNCADAAIAARPPLASETEVARKESLAGSAPRDQWSIQRVCDSQVALDKCVQRAGASAAQQNDAQIRCCPPNTGIALTGQCPQSAGGRNTASQFRLQIVCGNLATGGCSLDDIIQTGVNFANLLLALSGSIYLLIFVYAAIMYLTAGGSAERVGTAKKAITGATIGMVLMLGAYTIIRYVRQGITSSGSEADTCVTGAPNSRGTLYACQNTEGMSREEKASYDCPDSDTEAAALCPGTNRAFRCCLITPGAAAPEAAPATPSGTGSGAGSGTGAGSPTP